MANAILVGKPSDPEQVRGFAVSDGYENRWRVRVTGTQNALDIRLRKGVMHTIYLAAPLCGIADHQF